MKFNFDIFLGGWTHRARQEPWLLPHHWSSTRSILQRTGRCQSVRSAPASRSRRLQCAGETRTVRARAPRSYIPSVYTYMSCLVSPGSRLRYRYKYPKIDLWSRYLTEVVVFRFGDWKCFSDWFQKTRFIITVSVSSNCSSNINVFINTTIWSMFTKLL